MKTKILLKTILYLTIAVVSFSSCSTMKKTVSKSSIETKVSEDLKKDSVAVKAVDSISIKFLAKLDSMNEDSVYHTVTRIEEKIKVVNDTTKEIQRTTFIDAKGKTFRHSVKRASATQATQVNKSDSVKTEEKKSNVTELKAKIFDKQVKRTGLSWTFRIVVIVVILAAFLLWYFVPGFFPKLLSWFIALFKRRRNEGNN